MPSGSAAAPALTTSARLTTGTSCISTIQTGRPLASARFWIGGSFSDGAGPGTGGLRAIRRLLGGQRDAGGKEQCAEDKLRSSQFEVHRVPPFGAGTTLNSSRLSAGSQRRTAA